MRISDLWLSGDMEWRAKTVEQWVGTAGSGRLTNDSSTSRDFRELLSVVDFDTLNTFAEQCLVSKAPFAGLALQDTVNAIGQRLGFSVEYGVYQGTSKTIGFDGLWQADGDCIIVEIKTTDVFRVALDRTAHYLNRLVNERGYERERCSILYVVGRSDTGDLEAQIRGSRLAWTARLISVDALSRLLTISATLGDPTDRKKVYRVLRPFEYTKVDDIINLVFTAAESPEKVEEEPQEQTDEDGDTKRMAPPSIFHAESARRIGRYLDRTLVEKSRSQYSSLDGKTHVVVAVSKTYKRKRDYFWYAFHPYYENFIQDAREGYLSLSCGSPDDILLIPSNVIMPVLSRLNKTVRTDRWYYHIRIFKDGADYVLQARDRFTINLTQYRI